MALGKLNIMLFSTILLRTEMSTSAIQCEMHGKRSSFGEISRDCAVRTSDFEINRAIDNELPNLYSTRSHYCNYM